MNKLLRNVLISIFVITLGVITFVFRDPITQQINKTNDYSNISNSQNDLPSSKMTYGHFLEYVDMGWVTKVDFYENGHRAIVETSSPELGNRSQRIQVDIPTGASSQLITKLKTTQIDFDAHGNSSQFAMKGLIAKISLPIITIALVSFLVRRRNKNENNNSNNQGWGPFNGIGGPFGGFNGGPFNMRRTKRNFKVDLKTGIGFDDVAGVDEVKEEFQEVVDFLKTPEKFTELGAKVPRGVLLVGPPGTGKTLLAKAIAGEAGVPFMSISGSEFVEMFVGIGASRVRDAFKEAKKNAPCIVFIDEIDAVGRQRGAGVGGGNDEREQTLNQLLTEMDGFEGNSGIIVIAATNRVDTLDAALLRPGRFDRQISVNLPDLNGRFEILKIHARNKNLAPDVKLKRIAQRTPGFSGADLENILNEASILTARRNETIITQQDVNKSIERIIAGLEGNALLDTKNKRLVAYHEVGHAIVATMLKYHDPVEKVTIIPRGQASGLTWFTPLEDQGLISRGQILARITGALGGRVAEDLIFGNTEITTGANNDIRQVTAMARQMVTRYGMSKIGPIAFEAQPTPVFLTGRFRNRKNIPSETAVKIDTVVQEIINQCYNEAKSILMTNREAMDQIVDILMDKETLDGELFRKILSDYTELPKNIAVNYESYFTTKNQNEFA